MKSGRLPGTANNLFDDMLLQHHLGNVSNEVIEMMDVINLSMDLLLLLSNILPICAICCTKRLAEKQALDEVIVAFSVTAILSVLAPGPFGILAYVNEEWVGGATTCEFYHVTLTWFQLESLCLVTIMCIERWTALRHTLQLQASGRTGIRLTLVATYALTLGVAALPLFKLAPSAFAYLFPDSAICQAYLLIIPSSAQEHTFAFVYLVVGFANIVTAFMLNVSQLLVLWQQHKQCQRILVNAYEKEFSILVVTVTVLCHCAWVPALVSTNALF